MRHSSLRTLALLLTLLAQLFPLSALADAPSFSNLYDACDYLRTCMDARETEIALFLDENACARWETDEVREALCRAGFAVEAEKAAEGWVALLARRPR